MPTVLCMKSKSGIQRRIERFRNRHGIYLRIGDCRQKIKLQSNSGVNLIRPCENVPQHFQLRVSHLLPNGSGILDMYGVYI